MQCSLTRYKTHFLGYACNSRLFFLKPSYVCLYSGRESCFQTFSFNVTLYYYSDLFNLLDFLTSTNILWKSILVSQCINCFSFFFPFLVSLFLSLSFTLFLFFQIKIFKAFQIRIVVAREYIFFSKCQTYYSWIIYDYIIWFFLCYLFETY